MAHVISMVTKRTSLACMAMLISVSLARCGGGETANVGSVSGTVTLDGRPLASASIVFQPEKGRPASGGTDDNGYYSLSYSNNQSGAIVGPCQVTISTAFENEDGKVSPERVPANYSQPGVLTADVKSGSDEYNRAVARLTIFETPEDDSAFMRVLDETWQIVPLPICAMVALPKYWHFVV